MPRNLINEIRADFSQLFMNLFRVTDRKLGSGAFGEVRMAVDIVCKRQVACKMIRLGMSSRKRSGRVSLSEPLWREVELLKDLSHVRKEVFSSNLAHPIPSQTLYTLSVSSSPTGICMTASAMPISKLT